MLDRPKKPRPPLTAAQKELNRLAVQRYRERHPERRLEQKREWRAKKINARKLRQAAEMEARLAEIERMRPYIAAHNRGAIYPVEDLIHAIGRMIPLYVPYCDREDVTGDIILALMEGDFRVEDIDGKTIQAFISKNLRLRAFHLEMSITRYDDDERRLSHD